MNASFWSISVTSSSSANRSESKVLSSSPPNPAPRITTWRFIRSACSRCPRLAHAQGADQTGWGSSAGLRPLICRPNGTCHEGRQAHPPDL